MKRNVTFKPSMMGDATLEKRDVPATWGWYAQLAPPAKSATAAYNYVHNWYYAPLYSGTLAQFRTQANLLARGQITGEDAVNNLFTYYFGPNGDAGAIGNVSTGVDTFLNSYFPYRGANITTATSAINNNLGDAIFNALNNIDPATVTPAQLNSLGLQVASLVKSAYGQVRIAITHGGYPYVTPMFPVFRF